MSHLRYLFEIFISINKHRPAMLSYKSELKNDLMSSSYRGPEAYELKHWKRIAVKRRNQVLYNIMFSLMNRMFH